VADGRQRVALGGRERGFLCSSPGSPALSDAIPIRVVIVDDHQLFADALSYLLENDARVHLVGTASNAGDAIDLAVTGKADVVVMDIALPGIDGLEATRLLRDARPETAVLILSGADDVAEAARAAGATQYLTKGRVHEEVVDAIISAAGHDADHLPGGHGLAG
jgi:DNA-binding NarL/FixJ family response regulator